MTSTNQGEVNKTEQTLYFFLELIPMGVGRQIMNNNQKNAVNQVIWRGL